MCPHHIPSRYAYSKFPQSLSPTGPPVSNIRHPRPSSSVPSLSTLIPSCCYHQSTPTSYSRRSHPTEIALTDLPTSSPTSVTNNHCPTSDTNKLTYVEGPSQCPTSSPSFTPTAPPTGVPSMFPTIVPSNSPTLSRLAPPRAYPQQPPVWPLLSRPVLRPRTRRLM